MLTRLGCTDVPDCQSLVKFLLGAIMRTPTVEQEHGRTRSEQVRTCQNMSSDPVHGRTKKIVVVRPHSTSFY